MNTSVVVELWFGLGFFGFAFVKWFEFGSAFAVSDGGVDTSAECGGLLLTKFFLVKMTIEADFAFEEINFDLFISRAEMEDVGQLRHAPVEGVDFVSWGTGEDLGDGVHGSGKSRVERRRLALLMVFWETVLD